MTELEMFNNLLSKDPTPGKKDRVIRIDNYYKLLNSCVETISHKYHFLARPENKDDDEKVYKMCITFEFSTFENINDYNIKMAIS